MDDVADFGVIDCQAQDGAVVLAEDVRTPDAFEGWKEPLLLAIDTTAKKDWDHEAEMWDPMVKHIYAISDALADGIAKQFPDKMQ